MHRGLFQLNYSTSSFYNSLINKTLIFRGWVCGDCNSGGGRLGDTLEGVLQYAVYLEKDISKIIQKLLFGLGRKKLNEVE